MKSQQVNEQNSKIEVLTQKKRQSHQIKALIYKTATLQWKQPCTNICQLITPIICLIFTMLIRNIALQNLSSNDSNVYNKIPLLMFKFNDFQLLNDGQDYLFKFDCSRWFLYDWKNEADAAFIGAKDGIHQATGFLKNVRKTNKYNYCWVNSSFYQPYNIITKSQTPYFVNPLVSINNDIYERQLYFNSMDLNNIKGTSAVQKMPDGAIFFNTASRQSLQVDIKINDVRSFQLHQNTAMTRISIRDPTLPANSTRYQSYFTITQGFLNTIDMITASYIKQLKNQTIVSGYIYMPIVGNSSMFIEMLINIISTILFPLSLSLLLPVFLYNIVLEKETKIIQMMRMNGLGILTYWMTNFLFNFIASLLTYIIFYAFGYFIMQNAFFLNTSFLLIWIVLIGWIICQIGISMFFQVFISNSRAANIIGYLMTIWTNLIGATLSVALYQFPVQMPFLVSLWPTISFNRIFYLMFINCSSDHCFSQLSSIPEQLIRCIAIIYSTAIFFILVSMYLYEVIPQEFGISKHIFFPFQDIYHLMKRKKAKRIQQQRNQEQYEGIPSIKQNQNNLGQKQCSSNHNQWDDLVKNQRRKVKQNKFTNHALVCEGLTKVYDNGKKATSDFNLIVQDNEVFGLLGPNGAGKTTLISMITGIFSPTVGTAHVAGYSIEDQIDLVHMNMGVCPQFDILWDELTVQQHLYFYARLRGISRAQQKRKVEETLVEISLQSFAKFKVRQLSGGMKRRLSVAISLVGDPRIVFLDEPTTGLDPQNRRNLWQLLSKCKNKRSLFLTTHSMQEAQSLCDKIGIITSSYLRTLGNQIQLKKKYGRGYNLTVSIEVERRNIIQQSIGDSDQYPEDQSPQYQKRSESSSVHRQPSSMSAQYQQFSVNKMINDSLSPQDYRKIQEQIKISKLNTQSRLQILKKKILLMFQESDCRLIKQINGTLKFNLNPEMKISKVLEGLERLKHQMKYEKRNNHKEDFQSDNINNINNHVIQFEWSINNSSLQDVFLNVVQTFPKNTKLIETIQNNQIKQ